MPYLRCPSCSLTTYSPPSYTTAASCPDCGSTLGRDARVFRYSGAEEAEAVTRRLHPDVTAPQRARRALAELRGAIGEQRFGDVELITSELVANAVRHGAHRGGSSLRLRIELSARRVRVIVADDGDGFEPTAKVAALADVGGRGLLIVEKLADRWGVSSGSPTRVWFEVETGDPD